MTNEGDFFYSIDSLGWIANEAQVPQTRYCYFWQCGQKTSPAGKGNQHLYKKSELRKRRSTLKSPGGCLG